MKPPDRPAVVTGASSGIGKATARLLAAQGHPVVLGARRTDRCEKIAADIADAGGTAFALPLDLSDKDSREAFIASTAAAVGHVDVFVSNAGMMLPGTVLDADEGVMLAHLQVNVLGAHALTKSFGRAMVERGHGDLVFVTSEVVREPRPGVAPYVTSKFAIEGLVAVLRRELEGSGVRVSCVRPGPTLTEMGWDWDEADTARLITSWERWGLARHPHMLPPEGIASAVLAAVSLPQGVSLSTVDVDPVPPPRRKERS